MEQSQSPQSFSLLRFLPKGPLWELDENPLFSDIIQCIDRYLSAEYSRISDLYKNTHPLTASTQSTWYQLFQATTNAELLSKIKFRRVHSFEFYESLAKSIDSGAILDKEDSPNDLISISEISIDKFKSLRSAIDRVKQSHVQAVLSTKNVKINTIQELNLYVGNLVDHFRIETATFRLDVAGSMVAGEVLGNSITQLTVFVLPYDEVLVFVNLSGKVSFKYVVQIDNSLF